MEKSEIKGFIAKRCAKELKNGDVVNLGTLAGSRGSAPWFSPNKHAEEA